MDRWIRRTLERAFWDRIAVGNATRPHDAAALIESIKPKTATRLKRFGPRGDGGYLMPDDLEGITACISPGVSSECGFDEEIANLGIDVLMADASVIGPPKQHSRFHFFRRFVDIASTQNAITMDDLASKTPPGDLLLQMDIEGAEYRVLAGMSDNLMQRFRIMVIEFHELDQMFQRFAFDIMKPVFEKLTRHHHVVHAHPNNCAAPVNRSSLSVPPVMEFTFYRKDRVKESLEQPLSFPHALDASCVRERPPVALPACWR